MDRRLFLDTAAWASLALLSGKCSDGKTQRRANIVILFADDMGYGDAGCFGHPVIRTPGLDRLAAQGVRCTSFYAAAPTCTPSRASLLTGRYALRTGLPRVLMPESENGMNLSEKTLADDLKQAGYRTACIGKWHLGHARREFLPTSRGFDSYFGLLYSNDMIRPWVDTDRPLRLYRNDEPQDAPVDQAMLTQRYTGEAVRFIRESGKDPFFLYLAYSMPHLPVAASADFQGRSRAGLYGDVIEEIDWSVAEIIRTLEENGLDRNTLVLFASDNGPWCNMPARMLQNGIEPWHAGSPGLLRGAKSTTWEGGMRVPCMVRWPGVLPAGSVLADPASALDVLPTVLAAAGVPLPKDRILDGTDLLPALQGNASLPEREFFYFRGEYLEALRKGPWKLRMSDFLKEGDAGGRYTEPELYQLERNPEESVNLAGRHPEKTEEMQSRMRAFAAELNARIPQCR
ncbi:sulfatase [bacterium]|nr:sulfatase [bacterium]